MVSEPGLNLADLFLAHTYTYKKKKKKKKEEKEKRKEEIKNKNAIHCIITFLFLLFDFCECLNCSLGAVSRYYAWKRRPNALLRFRSKGVTKLSFRLHRTRRQFSRCGVRKRRHIGYNTTLMILLYLMTLM